MESFHYREMGPKSSMRGKEKWCRMSGTGVGHAAKLWGDMPFRFEFDDEHKILLVLGEGEIRDPDVLSINGVIASYVERLHPAAGISDLSAVTKFEVSAESMRTAAQRPPYPKGTPRFVVAPQDHLYGMARMYELSETKSGGTLRIVRNRQQALDALGVKDPEFKPVNPP